MNINKAIRIVETLTNCQLEPFAVDTTCFQARDLATGKLIRLDNFAGFEMTSYYYPGNKCITEQQIQDLATELLNKQEETK